MTHTEWLNCARRDLEEYRNKLKQYPLFFVNQEQGDARNHLIHTIADLECQVLQMFAAEWNMKVDVSALKKPINCPICRAINED